MGAEKSKALVPISVHMLGTDGRYANDGLEDEICLQRHLMSAVCLEQLHKEKHANDSLV